MSKIFMPDVTHKERVMILQETAAKVEQTTYQKMLSPDELAARHEDLAENCIKLSSIDDEKKEVMAEFKLKTDPLNTANRTLLTEIKTKQVTVDGTLYHLANHEEGFMETYSEEGELVSTRRLRPEEKQPNLFVLKNTGNG